MCRSAAVLGLALILIATSHGFAGSDSTLGISISPPKVYEERTLRAMLVEAERQLASLRPISGTKFDAAVGALQGGSETSTAFSLSASGLPQPAVETVTKETLDEAGNLRPSEITETATAPAVSPTPPAQSWTGSLAGTGFGLSARDLLSEQMALSYQIASLRLALERATSERLNSLLAREPGESGRIYATPVPRRAVVLGFTVGIDRPRKNQLAAVNLTLALQGESSRADLLEDAKQPPGMALVTVLPTKESYNVAAITESKTSIGAGQVVSVVQLGASFLRGRKTYYIVRDVDTVSTHRNSSDPNVIEIGWQFRPVLGRKTVDPGPRQVFVVLAIDDNRYDNLELKADASLEWVPIKSNGVVGFGRRQPADVDLGSLGYWQVFTDEQLAPFPKKPRLTPLSAGRALVSVKGSFLSPETKVLVGDTVIDSSNGLALSDETGLSFLVPLVDLARAGDAYLLNRFLDPTAIRHGHPDHSLMELRDQTCTPPATGGGGCCYTRVSATDRFKVVAHLAANPQPRVEDIVAVAGDVAAVASSEPTDANASRMLFRSLAAVQRPPQPGLPAERLDRFDLEFELPVEAVRRSRELTIREVFGGPQRTVRCSLPELPHVERVTLVRTGESKSVLSLQGRMLTNLKRVLVAGAWEEFTRLTDSMALVEFPLKDLAITDQVIVETVSGDVQMIAVKDKPVVAKPVISTKPEVVEGFSGPIDLQGEHLSSIAKVEFEGLELVKRLEQNVLSVFLVSKVTEKPAPRALILKLVDGTEQHLIVTVKPKA